MWEIKIYSRGGQGAVTAAKILIDAVIEEGKFGQAIPSYGQERSGAPVYTYARIADEEIETKSYVYHPNCVMCFDPSLSDLGIDVTAGIKDDAILVLNANQEQAFSEAFSKVYMLDADELTHQVVGEAPPNIAMLGAFVKATQCINIESLIKSIKRKLPGKVGEKNAEACKAAFDKA